MVFAKFVNTRNIDDYCVNFYWIVKMAGFCKKYITLEHYGYLHISLVLSGISSS